jgi:hypothetical protein
MNWEIVGSTGEWAGALAVVVTLFYLAKQIRQSNLVGIAEAEREWYVGWAGHLQNFTADEHIADIMQRGLANYSELTKPEQAIFHGRMTALVDHTDLLRRLVGKGLMASDVLDKVFLVCLSLLATEGGNAWWESHGNAYSIKPYLDEQKRATPAKIVPIGELLPVWGLSRG